MKAKDILLVSLNIIDGKTRLLNPDPFAKEALKDTAQGGEIVLNNVRPTFAAPIIAIIDPNKNNNHKYS